VSVPVNIVNVGMEFLRTLALLGGHEVRVVALVRPSAMRKNVRLNAIATSVLDGVTV